MNTETEVLIEECKIGNSEAFHKLFARYRGRVLRTVRLRLDEKTRELLRVQSMDVLQEVFAKAFQKIQDFNPSSKGAFYHWLNKIVENHVRDLVEQKLAQKRMAPGGEISLDAEVEDDSYDGLRLMDIIPAMNTSPTQHLHKKNIQSAIDDLMLKLNEDDREIVLQHKFEELTFKEIAEFQRKREDAVRKQYARALIKLITFAESDPKFQEFRSF